jgi:hypothetical protein
VTDHQGDAGATRRRDDAAALVGIAGDRLLHQDMDAAADAGERDIVV